MSRLASMTGGFAGYAAIGKSVGATIPGTPTIGTASYITSTTASVSFTPPASDGGSAITSYTVTASQGGITATGSSSPITVTGLTTGLAYTFTVHATNSKGSSPESSATSSIVMPGQVLLTYTSMVSFMYTTANTNKYSYGSTTWTVPAGVTSISIVCIGGGACGIYRDTYVAPVAGGGGGLAYVNNITVTPGETLNITYGPHQGGSNNGSTFFVSGIYADNATVWRGTPFTASATLLCGATGALKGYCSGTGSAVTGIPGSGGSAFIPGTGASPSVRGTSGSDATSGWGLGGAGGTGTYEATPTHNQGGGGAGGYGGSGGIGARYSGATIYSAGAGAYGGGGGGGYTTSNNNAGRGGGTSPYGIASGQTTGGAAGTNGASGGDGGTYQSESTTLMGGKYGGGGGTGGTTSSGYSGNNANMSGGLGCIRIVWPGSNRKFPSTDVGTDY